MLSAAKLLMQRIERHNGAIARSLPIFNDVEKVTNAFD
jgi:hypothetical protein